MSSSSSSWQSKAATKRSALLASIPSEWKLDLSTTHFPSNGDVRSVPRESGILTEIELEITEEDDIGVILDTIARQKWSSVDVTRAFCKRAAIAHQVTNCLTEPLFSRALARAAELDEHVQLTGKVVGPLHGLPISAKEQFDIAGVESTMGFVSRIGFISPASAVFVTLLESLGAIIHCRTNVPQTLLCDETINNVFGRTSNPWNTRLTAGGSSGGEAALLAMKGSPIGVGTDLGISRAINSIREQYVLTTCFEILKGGSIRKPASFCGLYSLRPTSRRLPYYGASNIFSGVEALESVCGPMARSRKSLEVFMKAVVGAKPWEVDSRVVEREWVAGDPGKKCFAIMKWDKGVRCHPPIERGLEEVAEALRKEGHEVVKWEALDHAEAQEIVSRIFDSDGGEDVASWIGNSGETILPQVFTSQHPAMSVYESWQLNKRRDAYRQKFLETWLKTSKRKNGETGRPIDGIICATAPHLAPPHLDTPRPSGYITYTTTWSLLDLPCYTFPVGVVSPLLDPKPTPDFYKPINEIDKTNWEDYSPERYENAPIVLQLAGPRRFREDELLGLGGLIEVALGKR